MKRLFILIFSLSTFSISAQLKRSAKLDKAIDALNNTEFIDTYKNYKTNVETTIRDFKSMAYDLDPYDVQMVKDSYAESKKEFDAIVENLKVDLIDKKTRNFISDYPDRYTKFIASEVEGSYEFFLNNTVTLIDDLTGYEYTGFGLAEVNLIVGLLGEITGMIKDIKGNMKKMTAEYFEAYFIADLRLAEWENI